MGSIFLILALEKIYHTFVVQSLCSSSRRGRTQWRAQQYRKVRRQLQAFGEVVLGLGRFPSTRTGAANINTTVAGQRWILMDHHQITELQPAIR